MPHPALGTFDRGLARRPRVRPTDVSFSCVEPVVDDALRETAKFAKIRWVLESGSL